ncbi:MAG TPA: DUF1016 N-terminal domain-containing protein, partial [Candidatus Binatia bacterium]|nr:DUF1016 N-terminal domain-containing protein [Candidatus Binatia bacterium]
MRTTRAKSAGRPRPRSGSTGLRTAGPVVPTTAFDEVVHLIQEARRRALQTVNAELIDLYWRVGEAISRRIAKDGWGQG